MKKILIVYATAGIGHKKAALAVKKVFDELALPDAQVSLIDALDYTSDFFKRSYLKAYLLMVNKLPLFWGLAYYVTNNFFVSLVVARIRRLNNWISSRKLIKFLIEFKPDVVISTHFFASEIIADLKEHKLLDSCLVTVVTDYQLHSWWVADGTDTYIVASEDVKNSLIRWKVDPKRIQIMGIPVDPIFTKSLDKEKILRDAGLKKDTFTVLVIGGGFGVGPIEEMVKNILKVSGPLQVIVVCGHNEELRKTIDNIRVAAQVPMKVVGFVDNVYEYMEVADILISKSGGITVSESLVKGLPMVVISPILGQETGNCDFLLQHGAAFKIEKVSDLTGVIDDVISHPEKMCAMRSAIQKIRKPNAAYDIAQETISLCRIKEKGA